MTPDVNEANPVSIVPNNFGNGRRFLTRDGQRNSLAGIGWAYRDDDAVPYDQVLALIAGGGGGDMLKAVYDPTGQNTDIFNIENILTGNNVAQTTLVFDAGSGAQTQVGVGQVLTGSANGTASMSSDGKFYSSDNGSGGPEHRTEILFDTISLMTGGVTLVSMDSTQAGFGDGTANINMTYSAGVANLVLTDNVANSSMSVFGGVPQMSVDDGLGAAVLIKVMGGIPGIIFGDAASGNLTLTSTDLLLASANYPTGFMNIDANAGVWYLGDLNDDANGTSIDLDDPSGRIRFRTGSNVIASINSSGFNVGNIVGNGSGVTIMDVVGIGAAAVSDTRLLLAGGAAPASSMRITAGSAPTAPVDGDIWYDGTDLKFRKGGTTFKITLS